MIKRTCFIIAAVGTKLGPLERVITQAGWEVLNFESLSLAASSLSNSSLSLIGQADAVIAVWDEPPSSNTIFETGLAFGRGLPILLVSVSDDKLASLEPDPVFTTLPRIRAKLTDNSALRFHITAFLESVEKGTVSSSSVEDRNRPFFSEKRQRRRSHTSPFASALEQQLFNIFQNSREVNAVHYEPRLIDAAYEPDFAIWLGDDRTIINPVLVEVTSSLHSERRLMQIQRYAIESGTNTIILVEGETDKPLTLHGLHPLTYSIGLVNLQSLIGRGNLLAEMVSARNNLAHGLR